MAFNRPVEVKPTLICVGRMKGGFSALQRSKTEGSPYLYENFAIVEDGTNYETKTRLMWSPEFWTDDKLTRSQQFLYDRFEAMLIGLCGDSDTWDAFRKEFNATPTTNPEEIHDFVVSFFGNLGPQLFGFVLTQQTDGTGEYEEVTGKDGKTREREVRVRTPYYQMDTAFQLTKPDIKSMLRRYEKNEKRRAGAANPDDVAPMIWKFQPSDYGIDIEVPEPAEPTWVAAS